MKNKPTPLAIFAGGAWGVLALQSLIARNWPALIVCLLVIFVVLLLWWVADVE